MALTLLRLLLAPLLGWAIAFERPELATLVFWLAVGSDVADGWVARRYGEVTRLGGVIDHAVDATFVSVGCLALAHAGVLPLALAPLIVLAFLQYAADSAKGCFRLKPELLNEDTIKSTFDRSAASTGSRNQTSRKTLVTWHAANA